MREEYSEDSRHVINNARHVSDRFRHDYITTAHILLGMLYYRVCDAFEMLEDLGVNIESLTEVVEKTLKPSLSTPDSGPILFTPSTKRMMEHAINEKRRMGMEHVEPSHLLLGILRDKESEATHILKCFKVTYSKVQKLFENDKYKIIQTEEEPSGSTPPNFDEEPRPGLRSSSRSKSDTPTLDHFGKDLTKMSKNGQLDKIIGRNTEIERLVHVLCRRSKSNAILLGASGCGKTAIVDGIAQRISDGTVPSRLKNKRIVTLELGSLVAGTRFRGEFEKRLQTIIEEVKKVGNVIIFIDEIHTMVGAGSAEGSLDASNILKPSLGRGEIQCIGATTTDEYRKHFESDNALSRRFQVIKVSEPSVSDTIQILHGIKKYYETFHQVKYSDDIIAKIVELAGKYMLDKNFPDKAIDVMDEVGAKVSLLSEDASLSKKIEELEKKKLDLIAKQKIEESSKCHDEILKLKTKVISNISEDHVRSVIGSVTTIPVDKVHSESNDAKRFLTMADELKKVIINQDEAIDKISTIVKRSKSGIKDPKRPNVLLFVGSSGTGKTFSAKKLAEFLFGSEKSLTYIDCSELSSPIDVNKLIGSSAGYVGYDDANKFEKIRQNPYSVILLDECEKAHRDVWNIFLRIFEEGEIEDSKGRMINFKNCFIIMTSNIGSSFFTNKSKIGFTSDDGVIETNDVHKQIKEEIKKHFRPEFLNRLDDTIIFNPLGKEELMLIVKSELSKLQSRLDDRKITLEVNANAIKHIVDYASLESKGGMGARPLKRAIDKLIEGALSDIILEQGDSVSKITVSLKSNQLHFTIKKKK
jgi:ATP-dependent Clp protease ATP-binding subunit ClpC